MQARQGRRRARPSAYRRAAPNKLPGVATDQDGAMARCGGADQGAATMAGQRRMMRSWWHVAGASENKWRQRGCDTL
jgi:hypothetical protein